MKEFKLTKQLKENWLKALKSEEYEQYGKQLRNPDNHKQMCCLGVLAHIHPNIEIKDEDNNENKGGSCIVNEENLRYDPFVEMGVHNGNCKVQLASNNDNSYNRGIRDYSEIIPLIEQLDTID